MWGSWWVPVSAETGNAVVCADVDAIKIDGLKRNVLPIYEPGLDELRRA